MTEPTIDPATGKPVESAADPKPDFVSKADFDALKQKLDAFESQSGGNYGPQPPTPPAPSGPSFDEQIATYDKSLEAIDAQIDAAQEDGKPIGALLRQRDKINSAKVRLEVSREIDPKLAAGMQTIDYLSGEVTRSKMPHLDIVKKDYDAQLSSLSPAERMNPQIRQAAYNIAVGQNIDKIVAAKEEEVRRSVASDPNLTPDGPNARTTPTKYKEGIPTPKDVLGPEAMAAIATKYGSASKENIDREYRNRGYSGWEGYYEKHKSYFGDIEGEA